MLGLELCIRAASVGVLEAPSVHRLGSTRAVPTLSRFYGITVRYAVIPTIVRVEARAGFRLWIEFDDRTQGEVSLEPRLFGPVFEPLRDPDVFAQVGLDECGAPSWPNGADLAPDGLYVAGRRPSGIRHR